MLVRCRILEIELEGGMRRLSFAILVIAVLLIGCGSTKNDPENPSGRGAHRTTNSSYEFAELNIDGSVKCTTEKRTFSSLSEFCGGLTQRMDNRACALKMRKESFSMAGCSGEFEETNFYMSPERLIPFGSGFCHILYLAPCAASPLRRGAGPWAGMIRRHSLQEPHLSAS